MIQQLLLIALLPAMQRTFTFLQRLPPQQVTVLFPSTLQVLGGLLLHQKRSPRKISCNSYFDKLSPKSVAAAGDISDQPVAPSRGGTLKGYGLDAAFLPSSDLFNAGAAANIADFYNLSDAAGQVSQGGTPFGFFGISLPPLPPGYPVFFEVVLPSLHLCPTAKLMQSTYAEVKRDPDHDNLSMNMPHFTLHEA
jgi:hypothetical protein